MGGRQGTRVEDYLAAEEPLEMRAGQYSLGVTLRTPGDDEDLVAGFLFTEGINRFCDRALHLNSVQEDCDARD